MTTGKTNKTQVLRRYFGMLPGQTLTEFVQELKALNLEERLDLAQDAALAMGMTPEDVDFPLNKVAAP